jgi:hypothetical protein
MGHSRSFGADIRKIPAVAAVIGAVASVMACFYSGVTRTRREMFVGE